MSALATLTVPPVYTFAPAGPAFFDATRTLLESVSHFYRGGGILNARPRPLYQGEFTTWWAAVRAQALLRPVLADSRIIETSGRWVVSGSVVGDWA